MKKEENSPRPPKSKIQENIAASSSKALYVLRTLPIRMPRPPPKSRRPIFIAGKDIGFLLKIFASAPFSISASLSSLVNFLNKIITVVTDANRDNGIKISACMILY